MPSLLLVLAALTRDVDDAGSPDLLNVTFNVDGVDVAVADFRADHPQAQGYLQDIQAVTTYHALSLTNSSVRIGNRGDNAWAPKHILLFDDFWSRDAFPIAMEDGPDAVAQFGRQRGCAHPAAPSGRAR
jgi:hypothetical protein